MKVRAELFLVLLILIMSILPAMWNKAVNFSYESSYSMRNYPDAARWLRENLGQNESAVVPFTEVYETLEPDLRERLIDYSTIWKLANVSFRADNSFGEILTVRSYLSEILTKKDKREEIRHLLPEIHDQIRYLLVSPIDGHSGRLFEDQIDDDLTYCLYKIIEFHSGSPWSEPISVYEVISLQEIFKLVFGPELPEYNVLGNVNVSGRWAGMEINCEGKGGVYITTFLNSSVIEKLFVAINATLASPQIEGNFVLYLDKDGDGKWGDWEGQGGNDTGILIPLPQKTVRMGEIYLSTQLSYIRYNIVQIGIVFSGDSPNTITVKAIKFYEVMG